MNTLPELKFDKRRSRVKNCPCGKGNKDGKFVPFKGHETKGYCFSCEQTFLPGLPNQDNLQKPLTKQEPSVKRTSFIPVHLFKKSLKRYTDNNFNEFLIKSFGYQIALWLIGKYFIVTSKRWQGANIFWQIDITGRVRTGKIMLYNPATGKRLRGCNMYVRWVHECLIVPKFNLRQCFFGEHLLKGNNKLVAIVESEKSACIATVFFPKVIWLAAGGIGGLSAEKCKVLKGRDVLLIPDVNAFQIWSDKAKEVLSHANFTVFNYLEEIATKEEREMNYDLADYLLKKDDKCYSIVQKIYFKYHIIL